MTKPFTGLTTHKPKDCGGARSYLGEPCLYHHHSTETGEARCWRSAETHACLECEAEIQAGRLDFSLDRLAEQHISKARRFWRDVSIEGLDDCWQWNANKDDQRMLFFWKRPNLRNFWSFHPSLVAMWLTYGDVGRIGSVSLCGNRRCCNPLHNRPLNLSDDPASVVFDQASLQSRLEIFKQDLIEHAKPEHLRLSGDDLDVMSDPMDDEQEQRLIQMDAARYHAAVAELSKQMLKDHQKQLQITLN